MKKQMLLGASFIAAAPSIAQFAAAADMAVKAPPAPAVAPFRLRLLKYDA